VDGDIGAVQSRIDLHCHPLTPAGKKEQSFGLILCIEAPSPRTAAHARRSRRRHSGKKFSRARFSEQKLSHLRKCLWNGHFCAAS
jgi:hypothetical protein